VGVRNDAGPQGEDAVAQELRSVFVPRSPEVFVHDADGNLTQDGRWTYKWDGENRLVAMETLDTLVVPTGPLPVNEKRKLEFTYDAAGRRVEKKSWMWNEGTSSFALTRFIYDGWNLLAEYSVPSSMSSSLVLSRSFTWGLDLSGTMQGAGGVGGLLVATSHGASPSSCFIASDGNGNVVAAVNTDTGTITATFDYGPFGESVLSEGPARETIPFRFSTKYHDSESGLLYYGFRYYNPATGRWLSRDPIGEGGGISVYGFVHSSPPNLVDLLGLWGEEVHYRRTKEWIVQEGLSVEIAEAIARADNGVDELFDPTEITNANWSWHFNRSLAGDSRLEHRDQAVALARKLCTGARDEVAAAAVYLGRALHPLQDWVAHGDFNRMTEAPTLSGVGFPETRHYWHNWEKGVVGNGSTGEPDDPELDSDGAFGRPTIGTMHLGKTLSNGDSVYWAGFHRGNQRIDFTESITKRLVDDFRAYVRANAKRCGECWNAFVGADQL
jgi:RHS repeat-associated protein